MLAFFIGEHMPSNLEKLVAKGIAKPPSGLDQQVQFEVYMGSAAYGVSSDTSDVDVYGFAIPNKSLVFPHQFNGEIEGFGAKGHRFEVYQQHHMEDGKKVWDYSIYNIVKYFSLVMANNPNMIDSLFVPERCILHMTPIGAKVRAWRQNFLHKRCWHTFKGYSYQMLHKLRTKEPTKDSKRKALVEEFGYDTKYAYNVVRLLNEVEQILAEGDLDLERSREQLKSIRRGDWTLQEIEDYFKFKEKDLEALYTKSELPWGPDENAVKSFLLELLEEHFGSLKDVIVDVNKERQALLDIRTILERVGV